MNIAVIGGTGIDEFDDIRIVDRQNMETPYGDPSSPVMTAELTDPENSEKVRFYFLLRHGEGHTISPSEINYRANIFVLKKLGVKYTISFSAVGSLKEALSPTMIVLPDQFIDWTKGLRERTFFTDGMVGHVSVAEPVDPALQHAIAAICEKAAVNFHKGGSYVCIEGPQFSSRAESEIFRSLGASVIGMTNVPEAYLAKEAGMAYATVAMVTDYDCWRDEHCCVEEILKILKINNKAVQHILRGIIPYLERQPVQYTPENKNTVITSEGKLTEKHRAILSVLMD